MRMMIITAIGALAAALALPTASHAQQNAGFQPVYTVPLVQLEDNGADLVQEAGFRSFKGHRGFRSRGFRSRGFHRSHNRGFNRGFHKRRSFHHKRFGGFRHKKFRKF